MNRSKISLLLVLSALCVGLIGDARARADDVQPPPTSDEGVQALADLKARFAPGTDGKPSPGQYAEITAAVAGLAAVTYGVGRTVYQANVAQTAKAARMLEQQIRQSQQAIERAVAPELERYGEAIMKLNRDKIAAGAERLSANDARDAIMKGLSSPEAKARIYARLRASLGKQADGAMEKILGPRSEGIVGEEIQEFYKFGELQKVLRGGNEGFAAMAESKLGQSIAKKLGESVAPSVGRLAFKAVIADLAAESLGARCLGALGLLGKGALRVMGSSTVLVATILLTPSDLGDDTMSTYYRQNPQALLELPNEQALSWMEQYPGIRQSVVSTRDIVSEMALASGDPLQSGDIGSVLSCPPAPAPDPTTPFCDGGAMPSS